MAAGVHRVPRGPDPGPGIDRATAILLLVVYAGWSVGPFGQQRVGGNMSPEKPTVLVLRMGASVCVSL